MSNIVLSASVRQNLLSLQSTADLLATTQERLSTGKKVNTALDNPTNFFTAQGLDNLSRHDLPPKPVETSSDRQNPEHTTIEEFSAEGFTHVECFCPRCRMIRLRPISWLPRIYLGLTLAQPSARLRCAECSGPLHSVKPWRAEGLRQAART